MKHVGALSLMLSSAMCSNIDITDLDCKMRRLLYSQSKETQPWRKDTRAVFDSLRLDILCGDTPPPKVDQPAPDTPLPTGNAVFVDSSTTIAAGLQRGTIGSPFKDVQSAIDFCRKQSTPPPIVLRGGIHFLNETLLLGAKDAGTTIQNYPMEEAWLSGGVMIPRTANWKNEGGNLYSLKLSELGEQFNNIKVPGLFTADSHRRLTRARFPNADVETSQWGYASADAAKYSIPSSKVSEWTKPPKGEVPEFFYVDLSVPNPSGAIKKDSAMKEYNTFGYGTGGVCNTVWAKDVPSYWCGNSSAGGWAEVDNEAAKAGQLNIPVGMTYDMRDPQISHFDKYANASGGLIHTWHSQSWFTNMFEINGHSPQNGVFTFSRGGQQGGRNWCRCDQCSYAAGWCKQHVDPKAQDTRLISGNWYIENIREELDIDTEFYHDEVTNTLYLRPNGTISSDDLVVPVLKRIVSLIDTSDITITGIGFRDAAYTFMDDWAAPSGGDWSIHRGGALFLENVESCTIRSCTFKRLDGNALFLSRKALNTVVDKNEFVWIGDGAMATWGDSDNWTPTNYPDNSTITNNRIHEIGLYEKQSSAWGQNKAANTYLFNNQMFNMPRAAINFNDNLVGGNTVKKNLIWNTCRESGDHGPINTWDRMPFLDQPGSFVPKKHTLIESNMIIANYGGSQGIDNDDGSSFYQINKNVFYTADGFKMDYGGHDSIFTSNLVITFPYDNQNCMNVGPFLPGHGHTFHNNTCLVGVSGRQKGSGCGDPSCLGGNSTVLNHVTSQNQCDESIVRTGANKFFTPNGTATMKCGNSGEVTLQQAQQKYNVEPGSTSAPYPPVDTIVEWATELLQ
eukprot:TRINITY_DN15378_c0_g3_i1.p1 TRINITY_DN15378_c0_g3~~TRINITY_DN15378_c0_g3_i1.p1  ORF type:complete len:862 (+),score=209.17 TRINITY_DN15378_c0_g3_i1:48-2588(+)